MRKKPASCASRAFTLVEAICALAITAVLMTTVLSALTLTVRMVQQSRESMRQARTATGIARILQADVAGAYRYGVSGLPTFVCRQFGSPSDMPIIELFSTHRLSVAPSTASEIVRIEYAAVQSGHYPGRRALVRKETPYVPGQDIDRTQTATERLADNIGSCEALLNDGSVWRPNWQGDRLPIALRLDVSFSEEPDDHSAVEQVIVSPLCPVTAEPMPVVGK